MKKYILLMVSFLLSFTMSAQTWKAPIHRVTGKPAEKTLRLRPKMHINIGTLLLETDSLKESKYYDGSFIGTAGDSLQIRLNDIKMYKKYENGIITQTTIPVKYYLAEPSVSSDISRVAITDIDILKYQRRAKEKVSNFDDILLIGSIAVLIISPFICYNYKENTFNAEHYQYWALGSTVGIIAGFTLQIMGGQKQIQFKPGWPNKDAKVWSFE